MFQKPWDGAKTLEIMGVNYQPQLVQDFFYQQYHYQLLIFKPLKTNMTG